MMKKIKLQQSGVVHHIAIIGAFIALFGIAGAYLVIRGHAAPATTTVSTTSAVEPDTTNKPLCSPGKYTGPTLCLSDNGNVAHGASVVLKKRNAGPNQNITLKVNTKACNNGKVSGTCPFIVGSGFNGHLKTDTIYNIKFGGANSNSCLGEAFTTSVHVTACNGTGTDWVAVPVGGGNQFVNAYSTQTKEYFLEGLSLGKDAIVGTGGENNFQTWYH